MSILLIAGAYYSKIRRKFDQTQPKLNAAERSVRKRTLAWSRSLAKRQQ